LSIRGLQREKLAVRGEAVGEIPIHGGRRAWAVAELLDEAGPEGGPPDLVSGAGVEADCDLRVGVGVHLLRRPPATTMLENPSPIFLRHTT